MSKLTELRRRSNQNHVSIPRADVPYETLKEIRQRRRPVQGLSTNPYWDHWEYWIDACVLLNVSEQYQLSLANLLYLTLSNSGMGKKIWERRRDDAMMTIGRQ